MFIYLLITCLFTYILFNIFSSTRPSDGHVFAYFLPLYLLIRSPHALRKRKDVSGRDFSRRESTDERSFASLTQSRSSCRFSSKNFVIVVVFSTLFFLLKNRTEIYFLLTGGMSMKVIKPSFEIYLSKAEGEEMLLHLEKYGRTCYKSEKNITLDSAKEFVRRLIENGHESVIEHEKVTVKVVCDRGVSHEIVRHRVGASYSQESTRYANYSKDRFGREITVIKPFFFEESSANYALWEHMMQECEDAYMCMIDHGAKPEEARSVLPNSLKTEIIITMNLREWRHFFKLRTSSAAHPQMREIARPMLDAFKKIIPVVFDDISY